MSDRWKMNRIGFVNFWVYDEEEFSFEDGKLLLRGQNGSGKSITTQSFIPFILDGDRSPGRLDSFGTKDRRMEYYFLGENDREEATGYLFLEFVKGSPARYRTLVIGQRARRGKAMDFWGFILLDGRRVGQDIFLYKEVGSTKIPMDRQEMKKALGEETPFTDAPREYKAMVNKYLFGFRKPEQYEQFIQLLIKVRAPKLSKDLNPTKIYEILNESLQTLSDEDLRVMVDAMEKMDSIQENLEQLNRAFTDLTIIRNEYKRYNQYMLAKKGLLYLDSVREVESVRETMDRQAARKQELETQKEQKVERQSRIEEELGVRRAEREGLADTELEDVTGKLDHARHQYRDAKEAEQKWDTEWKKCQEKIRDSERNVKRLTEKRELQEGTLHDASKELEELQETLQWDGHAQAMLSVKAETEDGVDDTMQQIVEYKHLITRGREAVVQYKAAEKQYDEQAKRLDLLTRSVTEQQLAAENARAELEREKDRWINGIFGCADRFVEWKIAREALETVERRMRDYRGIGDAGIIHEVLRKDFDNKRRQLQSSQGEQENLRKARQRDKEQVFQQIKELEAQTEIEPARSGEAAASRQKLRSMGIPFAPFYKTVEFSESLTDKECSMLESQLEAAGILDALVVAQKDQERIRQEFPEFQDAILSVDGDGESEFDRLTVSGMLDKELQKETARILRHIHEQECGGGICLRASGSFRHGILKGRMDKESEASYVGELARKRRKEKQLQNLRESLKEIDCSIEEIEQILQSITAKLQTLEEEYESAPGYDGLDRALQLLGECETELKHLEQQRQEQEKITSRVEGEKVQSYQRMLQSCKALPYGRTLEEYEEAENAAEEYRNKWQEICRVLQQIQNVLQQILGEKDKIEREEENADIMAGSRRDSRKRAAEMETLVRHYEEYLSNPQIQEKARKLQEVKTAIEMLEKENRQLEKDLFEIGHDLKAIVNKENEDKRVLTEKIGKETMLRKYFEEELSLKLVVERGSKTLAECAEEAVKLAKEGDLARELTAVIQSLYNVYQQHNGNLVSYGTFMEDCFEAAMEEGVVLRKRQRIASVWNGKKVYLEEFYSILKTAIEETELLIQEKDRELFEDILSQTISQQLTDRIAESRSWVKDMSALMKNMDTSMGLSFALDWRPRSADSEQELDTLELESILLRDRALLTTEDIEKVAAHFRSKIGVEKQRVLEEGGTVNYMDMVRDALDYRRWFAFQLSFYRNHGEKKPLTNAAFNRFSGGEKAMAMYVPLFAAVNAQYKKAENSDHPRMIALDEAFAGVDDKNISSMFALVERLDFDYIMNSQVLWGCFETVRGLKIAELLRPQDSSIVTVIHYIWNGQERVLDE